jgi:heme exporter protein D
MMPDLGKYAAEVLGSYGITLVLLAAIIGLTWWRGVQVRRALAAVEARQGMGNE